MVVYLVLSGPVLFGLPKPAATLFVLAFLSGHVSLMLLATTRRGLGYFVLNGTVLAILALGALWIAVIWGENDPETLLRALAAIVVLDVLGSISVPVLSLISKASVRGSA